MPPKVKKPIKKKVIKKKVVKQKQAQAQIQNVKQNQKVIINVPETKTKRKYTKRKAPTPTVQPIQLPQQPQQFQPNTQVQLNDLKQQLREREKALQKQIDEKLKREERNTEQEIMQRLGIRNKSEMNSANDFFDRLNQPHPSPLSSLRNMNDDAPLAPARAFTPKDKRNLLNEIEKEGAIKKKEKEIKKMRDEEEKMMKAEKKQRKKELKEAKKKLIPAPRGAPPKGKMWDGINGGWINKI